MYDLCISLSESSTLKWRVGVATWNSPYISSTSARAAEKYVKCSEGKDDNHDGLLFKKNKIKQFRVAVANVKGCASFVHEWLLFNCNPSDNYTCAKLNLSFKEFSLLQASNRTHPKL